MSFLKKFQTSNFPSAMKVVTSTVKVEGGLVEGDSKEAIKSVDGVSDCVNGSIRESGKDICKSYHSWLVKFKLRLYLEEKGLLELTDEECASIFKLKLTRI